MPTIIYIIRCIHDVPAIQRPVVELSKNSHREMNGQRHYRRQIGRGNTFQKFSEST